MQYFAVTYYGTLLKLLLALLVLAGVFCAFRGDPIRWKDLVAHRYHLVKGKGWIYFAALLLLILSFTVNVRKTPLTGEATISFNYDGASRGLNPNSTRFNQTDMLSDEILERVIRLGNFSDVMVGDLKEALEFFPKESEAGSGDNYRVSTEYLVKYNATRKLAELNGEDVLTLFCGVYREWFIERYSYNVDALKPDFEQIRREDYLDMCDYYDMFAEQISGYMSSMARRDAEFVSSGSGETFQTISRKASNIKSSLVQNLRVFVLNHGISKDATTYMGRLAIENVMLKFDAHKYAKSNENRLMAISKYEDDMARIVLVPTYDQNGQFYMSQTRIGIDSFAEEAESYAKQKTSVNTDIADNDYIFGQLENSSYTAETMKKAMDQIDGIEAELDEIAATARAAVREYASEQANDYMTIDVKSGESRLIDAWRNAFEKAVAFWAVLCLILTVLDIKREKAARRAER